MRLPEEAFRAIAPHRATDPATGDRRHASRLVRFQDVHENEIAGANTSTGTPEPQEILRSAESFILTRAHARWFQTVRRFRPLARRRRSTFRPLAVLIRFRNPCVLRRRRLCGWNVLFIFAHPPGEPAYPVLPRLAFSPTTRNVQATGGPVGGQP